MVRVAFLRGINVGRAHRVGMAALREALDDAGLGPVRTHLQSGNVLLDVAEEDAALAARIRDVVRSVSGVEAAVVLRGADELAAVVAADALGEVAVDPSRRFVAFCAGRPDARALDELLEGDWGAEQVVAEGREIVLWCPGGAHESPLSRRLAGLDLGTEVTVRNWRTTSRLAELAREP